MRKKGELDVGLTAEEEARLTAGIDFERIWERTADKIDYSENVKSQAGARRRAGRTRRILIAAAALAVCFGGAAYAVQNGYFESFFGIDPISDSQIVRVDQSQVSDGVRMTLAEVIPGATDSVATVAFERTDGEPFPVGSRVKEFAAELGDDMGGNAVRWRVSDDGRQLLAVIELFGSEAPIRGKTLTVKAAGIFTEDESGAREDVSDGRWEAEYTFDHSITADLKVNLKYELSEGPFQITNARISVMGIKLYGKWLDYEEGVSPYGGITHYKAQVKAVMKDGTELEFEQKSASMTGSTGETSRYEFILPAGNESEQEQRFIDEEFLENMKGISVDGTFIPME